MSQAANLPVLTGASLLGEQGMDAVKALAPRLGFLFRDMTKGDFGIDALVELFEPTAEPNKHLMTGRMIAVQIKCGEKIARLSDSTWRIYCSDANVNYWRRHSLPVILVYCDPTTNACYWTQIGENSLRRVGANWAVNIPQANKLEDAKQELTAIASAEPRVTPRTFPRTFTLPFDEQAGLQISDDEELGLLCAEIVAAASGEYRPEIAVEITDQPWVSAKLDEFETKPLLSIEERRQRVMINEIDRRYECKKKQICEAIRLMLTHSWLGRPYFGGQGDMIQGRALRRLVDSFTIGSSREPSALMIDVFPSLARQEPVIRISLEEREKDAFLEEADITDLEVQLVSHWGFTALDLPHEIFISKLLPQLARTLVLLADHSGTSIDELIEDIGVPIQAWVIGRS